VLIPTVDIIKNRYLFGIPITDWNGNEYADEYIQQWIDDAVAWLETELQIKITPTEFSEYHDYQINHYQQFCYLQLYQYPVIEVTSLKASYAGQDIMTFPTEWIKVYPNSGQVQLVPTTGSLSQILLGQGSGILLPLITSRLSNMPFLFQVTYTAGFDETVYTGTTQTAISNSLITLATDASATTNFYRGGEITILSGSSAGETSTIISYSGTSKRARLSTPLTSLASTVSYSIRMSDCPANVCNLIGMYATCGIMHILGDVLLGLGITNQSLSIDGLSESFGTPRSATSSLFSARTETYKKMFEDELPRLRERYKGIRMVVV
jgi:hypothetical protein